MKIGSRRKQRLEKENWQKTNETWKTACESKISKKRRTKKKKDEKVKCENQEKNGIGKRIERTKKKRANMAKVSPQHSVIGKERDQERIQTREQFTWPTGESVLWRRAIVENRGSWNRGEQIEKTMNKQEQNKKKEEENGENERRKKRRDWQNQIQYSCGTKFDFQKR